MVMTLLKLTLAVTLTRGEWQVEWIECQCDNYLAFVHERCLKSETVVMVRFGNVTVKYIKLKFPF